MPRDNYFACIWTKYRIWGQEILPKRERIRETWEARRLFESDSNQFSRDVIERASKHKLHLGRKYNGEKYFSLSRTVQRRGRIYCSHKFTTFRDMEGICWRWGLTILETASRCLFRDSVKSIWLLLSRLHLGEGIRQQRLDDCCTKLMLTNFSDSISGVFNMSSSAGCNELSYLLYHTYSLLTLRALSYNVFLFAHIGNVTMTIGALSVCLLSSNFLFISFDLQRRLFRTIFNFIV